MKSELRLDTEYNSEKIVPVKNTVISKNIIKAWGNCSFNIHENKSHVLTDVQTYLCGWEVTTENY